MDGEVKFATTKLNEEDDCKQVLTYCDENMTLDDI